jgi:uncharacterized protein (TIGR00369 family)
VSRKLTIADMQALIDRSRFHQLFRPEVLDADNDKLRLVVKLVMDTALERQPETNQWHGGAIAAAIDTVGCYALTLLAGELVPTLNFRTDYLRPAVGTDLKVIAQVRRAGRNVGVVDVDIEDDGGRLIALGRGSYSIQASLGPA